MRPPHSRGSFFYFLKKVLALTVHIVYNKYMEKKETKVVLAARVDQELYDKVESMAEAQNRSVSNMVETLLKEALKDK